MNEDKTIKLKNARVEFYFKKLNFFGLLITTKKQIEKGKVIVKIGDENGRS